MDDLLDKINSKKALVQDSQMEYISTRKKHKRKKKTKKKGQDNAKTTKKPGHSGHVERTPLPAIIPTTHKNPLESEREAPRHSIGSRTRPKHLTLPSIAKSSYLVSLRYEERHEKTSLS